MPRWVFAPAARAEGVYSFLGVIRPGGDLWTAGSTVGWWLFVKNSGADGIEATAINAGSFLNLDPVSYRTRIAFRIILPIRVRGGATVTANYVPGRSGSVWINGSDGSDGLRVNSGRLVLRAEI